MKKPELISPAGDFISLKAAIDANCDAVYFGLKEFNMRQSAKNFTLKDLKQIGKLPIKKYLTLNTIIYDNELKKVKTILEKAYSNNIDAVVCWDPAVIELSKDIGLRIHLSTQASVANLESANFYKRLGIKRIVLARELSLKQIKEIKEKTNLEIETFIHGALCVSISGRCFISQFLHNRSANRGDCLQPCRRPYLIANPETGKHLRIGNSYILSPKDLCTLPFLDKLIKAKIDAFKIEGRSRSPEYVKTVTECYRTAIDAYYKDEFNKKLIDSLLKKLQTVYNRKFSSGFFLGLPTSDDFTDIENSASTKKKIEIGKVINYYKNKGVVAIKLTSDNLKINDTILIMGNKTGVVEEKITSMQINYKNIKSVKKGEIVAIALKNRVRENDTVYKIRSQNKYSIPQLR